MECTDDSHGRPVNDLSVGIQISMIAAGLVNPGRSLLDPLFIAATNDGQVERQLFELLRRDLDADKVAIGSSRIGLRPGLAERMREAIANNDENR